MLLLHLLFLCLRTVSPFQQTHNEDFYFACFDAEYSISWENGESLCNNYINSHLATISSSSDNAALVAMRDSMGESSYDIMFGLNDRETDGTWVYTDGSDYTYTNWKDGSAEVSSNKDCAEIDPSNSDKWNDAYCTSITRKCFACNFDIYNNKSNLVGNNWKIYNITVSIGSDSDEDNSYYFGLISQKDNTSNYEITWTSYKYFYDTSSTYSFYPNVSGMTSNVEAVLIALDSTTSGSDSIALTKFSIDGQSIEFDSAITIALTEYVSDFTCRYLLIMFGETNITYDSDTLSSNYLTNTNERCRNITSTIALNTMQSQQSGNTMTNTNTNTNSMASTMASTTDDNNNSSNTNQDEQNNNGSGSSDDATITAIILILVLLLLCVLTAVLGRFTYKKWQQDKIPGNSKVELKSASSKSRSKSKLKECGKEVSKSKEKSKSKTNDNKGKGKGKGKEKVVSKAFKKVMHNFVTNVTAEFGEKPYNKRQNEMEKQVHLESSPSENLSDTGLNTFNTDLPPNTKVIIIREKEMIADTSPVDSPRYDDTVVTKGDINNMSNKHNSKDDNNNNKNNNDEMAEGDGSDAMPGGEGVYQINMMQGQTNGPALPAPNFEYDDDDDDEDEDDDDNEAGAAYRGQIV